MAGLPTNAFATYEAIGNREDLSDIIYRIDPTDTPFLSGIDREKADAVNHEWQLQKLAAVGTNAQLEGDDVTADSTTPTARIGNICQISRKAPRVTGTQRAVDHAGRGDEMAYQEMLKGLELKRDMENQLVGRNVAKAAGADAVARVTASVLSWIFTNTSIGTGAAADPAYGTPGTNQATGTLARTDGTQRNFAETLLKTVLQKIWTAGGKPDTIMVGAFNKQVFSTFTGRATPTEDTRAKKITASVTAYDSDFGMLDIVPNRFSRPRDALVLQMDMWACAYLSGRKMVSFPIAKTGDSDCRVILSEYALVSRNEASSGGVFDLTTA